MTKTELLELIANGESSDVELKRDAVPAEQLARIDSLGLTWKQLTSLERWYCILSRVMQEYLNGRGFQPPAPLPAPP